MCKCLPSRHTFRSNGWYVPDGPVIFREKVTIPAMKAFITLEGSGADVTVVQWGDTAQTLGPNGRPLGTFSSATFAINSPYFMARNITFQVNIL